MNGFYTNEDAVQAAVDFLGGAGADAVLRDARRAIQAAYRDLTNAHNWTYLYRQGRVQTTVPLSEGTVTYDHTGGTYERMLTLTPGGNDLPWPSWAAFGTVRIGTVNIKIAERKSDTVCTLDELENPGADITDDTGFILYQDTYLLPDDYVSQDQALYERNFGGMIYAHPRDWAYNNRYLYNEGIPQFYTIIGDPRLPGRLTLRVFPFPTDALSIDFVYKRRPRPISLYRVTAGTLATTAGSTEVTASTSVFTPAMIGSVVRVSSTATAPTGPEGATPAAFESAIASYIDATHVALYDPAPATYAASGYTISDPIDIEVGAMLGAYRRGVEKELTLIRNLKEKSYAMAAYEMGLREAKAADSRSFARRHEGVTHRTRMRLQDMPSGPDES